MVGSPCEQHVGSLASVGDGLALLRDGEIFFATLQEEVAQHVVEPLGIADAFAGTVIKDFGIKGCREF